MAAVSRRPTASSDDVVGKVLRRAEVAKMARKLQDRLALASYKTLHGQEGLSFKDVEARLESTLQRKTTFSGRDTSSSCSSSSDEPPAFLNGLASSPLTAPNFSDGLSGSSVRHLSLKRPLYQPDDDDSDGLKRKKPRSNTMGPPGAGTSRFSWKSAHSLAQSSPAYSRFGQHFSTSHGPNISFASEISTIPDSPPFGHASDDDERNGSRHTYHASQSGTRSSPPRTPPPSHHRKTRLSTNGEEGADLLLYLATSPSPAQAAMKNSRLLPPSTPPSKDQNGSNPALATPGLTGLSTPGQQFNFADFVNITPSPAQGVFGNRTPGLTKTPLAARDARRRFNFDSLAPPSGSPNPQATGKGVPKKALGMELGGELVS